MTTSVAPNLTLPDPVARLTGPYPAPQPFHDAVTYRGFVAAIARLWLSEGIPFAFQGRPAIYESLRSWLADRLSVNAKDITVIGSSRIGFSLSPTSAWRPHTASSDLDFSIISSSLFDRVRLEFDEWTQDVKSGVRRPDNRARRYWLENISFGRRNIPKGFVDPGKIPLLYPTVKNCAQSLFLLRQSVATSSVGLNPSSASIRVYQTWDVLVSRLVNVLPQLPPPVVAPSPSPIDPMNDPTELESLRSQLLSLRRRVRLTELSVKRYSEIVARDPTQAKFIVGWTNRAFSGLLDS